MIDFCAQRENSIVASAFEDSGLLAPPTPAPKTLRAVHRSSAPAPPEFQRPASRRRGSHALAPLWCIAGAVLTLLPCIAIAHAIIVAAQPAMNSTVALGEIAIRLDFNSRIDSKRSGLSLQGPDGGTAGVELTPEAPPGVLRGRARVTVGGRWKLRWQVLSLDGHITRGEVSFSVRDAAGAR